jgi:hypothetical protein
MHAVVSKLMDGGGGGKGRVVDGWMDGWMRHFCALDYTHVLKDDVMY